LKPLSPRSLLPASFFERSSDDVRRHCCAVDVEPRWQDRGGTLGGIASRSSGIRKGSRVRFDRQRHLAATRLDARNRRESFETSSSVIEASERLRSHRNACELIGSRRNDPASVVGLRRRSELVEVGPSRRCDACSIQGRVQRRGVTGEPCTVPRPRRSNDVGRRSRTVRRGRGAKTLSRMGLARPTNH